MPELEIKGKNEHNKKTIVIISLVIFLILASGIFYITKHKQPTISINTDLPEVSKQTINIEPGITTDSGKHTTISGDVSTATIKQIHEEHTYVSAIDINSRKHILNFAYKRPAEQTNASNVLYSVIYNLPPFAEAFELETYKLGMPYHTFQNLLMTWGYNNYEQTFYKGYENDISSTAFQLYDEPFSYLYLPSCNLDINVGGNMYLQVPVECNPMQRYVQLTSIPDEYIKPLGSHALDTAAYLHYKFMQENEFARFMAIDPFPIFYILARPFNVTYVSNPSDNYDIKIIDKPKEKLLHYRHDFYYRATIAKQFLVQDRDIRPQYIWNKYDKMHIIQLRYKKEISCWEKSYIDALGGHTNKIYRPIIGTYDITINIAFDPNGIIVSGYVQWELNPLISRFTHAEEIAQQMLFEILKPAFIKWNNEAKQPHFITLYDINIDNMSPLKKYLNKWITNGVLAYTEGLDNSIRIASINETLRKTYLLGLSWHTNTDNNPLQTYKYYIITPFSKFVDPGPAYKLYTRYCINPEQNYPNWDTVPKVWQKKILKYSKSDDTAIECLAAHYNGNSKLYALYREIVDNSALGIITEDIIADTKTSMFEWNDINNIYHSLFVDYKPSIKILQQYFKPNLLSVSVLIAEASPDELTSDMDYMSKGVWWAYYTKWYYNKYGVFPQYESDENQMLSSDEVFKDALTNLMNEIIKAYNEGKIKIPKNVQP